MQKGRWNGKIKGKERPHHPPINIQNEQRPEEFFLNGVNQQGKRRSDGNEAVKCGALLQIMIDGVCASQN